MNNIVVNFIPMWLLRENLLTEKISQNRVAASYRRVALSCVFLLQACASTGIVKNQALDGEFTGQSKVVNTFKNILSDPDQGIMLAFSGGGTRAAALSYGVLKQMQEITVGKGEQQRPILDDVALISSVSGGSFTAAYYGVNGKQIFNDYETDFLRKNVESALVRNLFNPFHWFGKLDRTEYAIRYYDKEIFKNATFADMDSPDRPLVLINATDLSNGTRFSFMQEYFNLLCSDLSSFSVSRAVTASSAVPVLFDPVIMKNHDQCSRALPRWLRRAKSRADSSPELLLTVQGLEAYFDRDNHQYSHFVDGGITDNLGLRAIFDMTQLTGDGRAFLQAMKAQPASRLVLISVDASTHAEQKLGRKPNAPSLFATINAMTDIQISRYTTATYSDMRQSLTKLAKDLSTESTHVDVYFIRIGLDQIQDEQERHYINQVPTSFNLTDAQVDALIKAGQALLCQNQEFHRLLNTINSETKAVVEGRDQPQHADKQHSQTPAQIELSCGLNQS